MDLINETLLGLGWRGGDFDERVEVRNGSLCVRCHGGAGGRAAYRRHLVQCLARNLGHRERWLQERNEQVLRQFFRRLTVQECIEESPEALVVNVLWVDE